MRSPDPSSRPAPRWTSGLIIFAAAGHMVIPALMVLSPAGFLWLPVHPPYERMIAAMLFGLGVALLGAARAPARHGLVLLMAALADGFHALAHLSVLAARPEQAVHWWTDTPPAVAAAVVLGWLYFRLTPRAERPLGPGALALGSAGYLAILALMAWAGPPASR